MEKKINKCASAIIDGLGYEIISDKGRIIGFQDKESQNVFGRSGGDGLFNSYELKDGLKLELYYQGSVRIVFPNQTTIYINNSKEPNESILMGYNITPERKKYISINYIPSTDPKKGGVISVRDKIGVNNSLEYIYANDDETKWHSLRGEPHKAYDLTSEKIMELLEDCFKNYNDGNDLNDDLKHGLEVINPAINIITANFKKSWATRLNNRIISNTKISKENKDQISTMESIIDGISKINGEIHSSILDKRTKSDELLCDPEAIDFAFKSSYAALLGREMILEQKESLKNEKQINDLRNGITAITGENNRLFYFNLEAGLVVEELLSDPVIAKLYEKKPESQWRKTGEN